MPLFKNIDYAKMLYETLRNYHSVTKVYFDDEGVQHGGVLSDTYKFCLCCLYVLQSPWNSFHTWRIDKLIIANCKWQIGQLTNVLNHFFDPVENRIYITQRRVTNLFAPVISGNESTTFAVTIGNSSTIFAPTITDAATLTSEVQINVPSAIYNDAIIMSQLVSVIEQVKITGINYQIVEII